MFILFACFSEIYTIYFVLQSLLDIGNLSNLKYTKTLKSARIKSME
jgi:hypothetical protein